MLTIVAACSNGKLSAQSVHSSTSVAATGGSGSSTASIAIATTTVTSSAAGATGPAIGGRRPNVLFVLTDDMRFDDLQYLPQVRALVGDAGVSFDDEFDNVTLCCPARTSILRGQYSHNTGVLTNDAANGGFERAHATNIEQSTVATAMHAAGYSTGLFGKYLNGYPNTVSVDYVPPGWDTWSSASKGNPYSEYDYTLNQNGKQVAYAKAPQDYGTDVYVRQTKAFIDQAAKDTKPFFAYLAVYAPHQPATPAPQDSQAFVGLKAPRDPSFDEADLSDKPQYIRDLAKLTTRAQAQIDVLNRRRAQSLQAVDRGVAQLVDELRANGQLDNTYIVFTSDNGFHLGQHRMPAGKQTAYETDIHLPLLVRGPGVAAGAHVSAITGNVDLAPTIASLGAATMTDDPDGRSLAGLLHATPSTSKAIATPPGWRDSFLLEHWSTTSVPEARPDAAELEPDDPDQGGATPEADDLGAATTTATTAAGAGAKALKIPEFQGLRVANYTYVEYITGERELYDLTSDPNELNNLAAKAKPTLLAALHQRLEDLRHCAADSCRNAESQPLNLTG